jgi:hypothetical protein
MEGSMNPRRVNYFVFFPAIFMIFVQIGAGSVELSTSRTDEPTPAVLTKSLSFHSDLSEFRFVTDGNHDYVLSEGLKYSTQPGQPSLPMKTMVSEFQPSVEILEVSKSYEKREPIPGSFNIAPAPELLTWDLVEVDENDKNAEVEPLGEHYPSDVFSYTVGEDSDHKYLFVHFYPLQYNQDTGELSIVTDIVIDVRYRNLPTDQPLSGDIDAECVIITPPELYWEARDLALFHDDFVGVTTAVVNTTQIYSDYDESPDPPFPGYKDDSITGWDSLVSYDYSLAKRIINFLNDTSAHPNLSYVLIYGNGISVPPSYYYYFKFGGFPIYEYWVPTDFFYSSPDYDFIPDFRIGRLPVSDPQTAARVNEKIRRWYNNLTGDWTKNVVVAGGRAFLSPFYIGELIVQDAVNRGFFEGYNLTKMIRSDYKFDREDLLSAFSGEVALTYLISHGSGKGVLLNESKGDYWADVTTEDIMGLNESSNLSVVVSIACGLGSFDSNVTIFRSTISFGESIVLSRAGGIAFIGGSRLTYGGPYATIEEGYLDMDYESYMAYLLTRVVQAYSEGAGSLGDITRTAIVDYVAEHDMLDQYHQRNIFEFVLLGDPVLSPPSYDGDGYTQPREEASYVHSEDVRWRSLIKGTMPKIRPGEEVNVGITTDSPLVNVKIVDTLQDVVIERGRTANMAGKSYYKFVSNNDAIHLFRALSLDGKEGWFFLRNTRHPYAPSLRAAFLSGVNHTDVTVSWYRSGDDGRENGTTLYRIMKSEEQHWGPWFEIGRMNATGQPVYDFTDVGSGDGDTKNYFYFVQSVNEDGCYANSTLAMKTATSLKAGLQLFSFPHILEDSSVESALRTLDFRSVWSYDSVNGSWKMYDVRKKANDLKELNHTMGYWIDVTGDDYLVLAGLVPGKMEIYLREGWNLVSCPSFGVCGDVRLMKFKIGLGKVERVEGFDPDAPPYYLRLMDDRDDLMGYQGYWVKVTEDAVWEVYGD